MDGGFSSVTFICSKTDDISLEEAQDSLGLSEEMAPDWAELDKLVKSQKSMKKRLEEMKDTKAAYGEAINDADDQIEIWDALQDDLESGKTVFQPKPKAETKKRKLSSKKISQRKKARRCGSSEDEESEGSTYQDSNSEDDEETGTPSGKPLTREQITAKLQELKSTKKEARTQKLEITENMTTVRREIEDAKNAEEKIESKLSAMCISGRNQYSKGAIQQDFAAGIKELDQELGAEDDEQNFDPDADVRDYDEVARGLPVFCVRIPTLIAQTMKRF